MTTSEYDSPCGRLLIGTHSGYLCLCDWMAEGRALGNLQKIEKLLVKRRLNDNSSNALNYGILLDEAKHQLDEYFEGKRMVFNLSILPLGTDFQETVWQTLNDVSYGQSASYSYIAEKVGRPKAVRAVANAIGANPLSILIPCHRIIGANGSLTGYAGGIEAKRFLLQLERNHGKIS